ncbi:MAG: hypothetical protein RJQ34_07410 [Balneola sp.]
MTLELERELLVRNPLHRLIITKGLRSYNAYSRISQSVMIAPPEPSLSLRSLLANNSKGRCSWKLFLKMSGRLSRIIFVSELADIYNPDPPAGGRDDLLAILRLV